MFTTDYRQSWCWQETLELGCSLSRERKLAVLSSRFFSLFSKAVLCKEDFSLWWARNHSHPCGMCGPFLCLLHAGSPSQALVSQAHTWSLGHFPREDSMGTWVHPQSLLSLCRFLLSDTLPVIPAVSASLTFEFSSGNDCWAPAPLQESLGTLFEE